MLVLREDQMAILGRSRLPHFFKKMEQYIVDEFPDTAAEKAGELSAWVEDSYFQGKMYGMVTQRDHAKFLNYKCIFGDDFTEKYPFANDILLSEQTANRKLSALKESLLDHLNRD